MLSPRVSLPTFYQTFLLDTDANDTGIGAVLSQLNENGGECVITYASRLLSKPERSYCVTRRELLAVVVFTKYFQHFLIGKHFTLHTDHGSLTWLRNFREPDGPVVRTPSRVRLHHFPSAKKETHQCRCPLSPAMSTMWLW